VRTGVVIGQKKDLVGKVAAMVTTVVLLLAEDVEVVLVREWAGA